MSRAGGTNPRAMAGQLGDDASEVDLSAELQVRSRAPWGPCKWNLLCRWAALVAWSEGRLPEAALPQDGHQRAGGVVLACRA